MNQSNWAIFQFFLSQQFKTLGLQADSLIIILINYCNSIRPTLNLFHYKSSRLQQISGVVVNSRPIITPE